MLNCEVIAAIENTNLDVKIDRLMKMLTVFENVRCLLMFFMLNYQHKEILVLIIWYSSKINLR